MKTKILIYFILLPFSTAIYASPKIIVNHQRTAQNLAQIQVVNQTTDKLICYVAIDGYKVYFRLSSRQPSKWHVATDERFNHASFSTWCDYIALHPQYQKN